jgi:WD40 repeat protein
MLTLSGHSGYVFGLCFDPGGGRLASASYDGTVRVWSMPSGEELARLTSPCAYAHCVDYSPDGRWLAAGFGMPTGVVQFHPCDDLHRPVRSDAHDGVCRAVRFARDGSAAYSAGGRSLIRHDPTSGPTARHGGRDFQVFQSLDVADDGGVLALAAGRVVRFDAELKAARPLFRVDGRTDATQVRCRGLGPRAVAAGKFALAVWDGPPDRIARRWDADSRDVFCVTPARAGTALTGGADGIVKFWNLDTGDLIRTYDWQIGEVLSVAVSADGLLAAAGGLADIVVWDFEA